MFRFNNPDAVLVLLMPWAPTRLLRAQERAPRSGSSGRGRVDGAGVPAKKLQAFLVVPAFGFVYM